jgi:hypothetical protein
MFSLQDQISERVKIVDDLKQDLSREKSQTRAQAIRQTMIDLEMQVGYLRKQMVQEAQKKPPEQDKKHSKQPSSRPSSSESSELSSEPSSSSSNSDSANPSENLPLGEVPSWRRSERKVRYGLDGCPELC